MLFNTDSEITNQLNCSYINDKLFLKNGLKKHWKYVRDALHFQRTFYIISAYFFQNCLLIWNQII